MKLLKLSNEIKKVICWRLLATIVSTIITYAYLGSLDKSLGLVVLLTLIMTIVNYYFEKFWKNYESCLDKKVDT
jgi:uncharacterized membrane protein